MSNTVTIKANSAKLAASEAKLTALSKKVKNRQVSISFSKARGDVPDALTDAAAQLNEIGEALALLISNTATAVKNTRVAFTEADETSARKYWLSE